MHLSRLTLNPQNYDVQKELGNIYQLHRTIMHAFPDNLHNQPNRTGRVLFRVEPNEQTQIIEILVQSPESPKWSFLEERNGYLYKPVQTKAISYPNFEKNDQFWFKILANPTKKIRRGPKNKAKSVRVGIMKEQDQYS